MMEDGAMAERKPVNGIDVDQLFEAIGQIKESPDLGAFQFRAKNEWVNGTSCRASIAEFHGAGKEFTDREAKHYDIDEPPVLLGQDRGSNPVEYLLVSLSGCLTTTLVVYAAAKGVELKGVSSRYEGDLDVRGFMNISRDVPVGYKQIKVVFDIDADISREQKEELVQLAQKYSPVYNTLANPSQVSVMLESEPAMA
jgi:uncharacterized OsmC-like protein